MNSSSNVIPLISDLLSNRADDSMTKTLLTLREVAAATALAFVVLNLQSNDIDRL